MVPTDEEGKYLFGGLLSGTYYVSVATAPRYVDEIYDDLKCPSGSTCDATRGTPIAVTQGVTTPDIDFALSRPGFIAGTVTASGTGRPLGGVVVQIWDTEGRQAGSAVTGDDGKYRVRGLAAGTYFATTTVFGSSEPKYYRQELFDDFPCSGADAMPCDPTLGTPITVGNGAITPAVHFALDLESGIEGVVTDEKTGKPLPNVAIDFWGSTGRLFDRVVTNGAGRYGRGLHEGVYYLSTDNGQGAEDEIYDDLPCPGPASEGFCDVLEGTQVEVAPSTVRTADFALGGAACVDTETDLCLQRRRFRVEVAWQDPAGTSGSGRAVELTSDSGYYWFFSADNVELVIKVLNGCFDPFDSYWVFAAGLTNVRVEIKVTDTATGVVKTYVNPQGRAFRPILDTAAFATCGTPSPALSPPAAPDPPLDAVAKGDNCPLRGIQLCLNDERFRLEILWRTPDGEIGQARAVPLTADTGYFWFFSEDNVEVVAKVLNACDIEPFHSFWVFAAGLTNVEVTLRVTDTLTGDVKEYFNPLGRPFRSILDTSAFATCP